MIVTCKSMPLGSSDKSSMETNITALYMHEKPISEMGLMSILHISKYISIYNASYWLTRFQVLAGIEMTHLHQVSVDFVGAS